MPFKTILTVVGPNPDDHDLKLAAGMCEEGNAHLSVLVVSLAAPPPIGEFVAMVSEAWVQERQADLEQLKTRTAAISALLASSPLSTDISSEYPDVAWAGETVGRRGRYADLTIAGPTLLSSETLKREVIEGALFHSGKPILIAPKGSKPTLTPKRVTVGWDTRIEASRALREALEMLAGAEDVRIVIVDPIKDEYHHGDEPGADVAIFLARHGVKVTIDRLPSENRSVADVLRRHAVDSSADMLVMGAYGHSRLRERIFGGVTKSMLDKPPLPIFLAR